MKIKEKLLYSLSRKAGNNGQGKKEEEWDLDNALSSLNRAFPDLINLIRGKNILDFGCGMGYQAVSLAKGGAKYVLGIDINQKALKEARDLAKELNLEKEVEFAESLEDSFQGKFDIVISQNSMEHFKNPVEILNEMKSALNKDGIILITFGPPWLAPYGSHMQFFAKVPWVNIIFDERTVMNVRSHFRNDGATRYADVEGGLNKMTVAGFERIIANSGLQIEHKKYDCVKGINSLGRLPIVREFFVNNISCVLKAKRSS